MNIFKQCWFVALIALSSQSIPISYAGDITAIQAYMMLKEKGSKGDEQYRQYNWTGEMNGTVSAETRNWNRPLFEIWGVSDRYPGTKGMPVPVVQPYSVTDPGFNGPNGEEFGIEVEFGDTSIEPRVAGSKNVRFYTDFGQTNAASIGMTRAEIHIRTTLQKMNIEEGDTLWLGWSEYYTHLDRQKITTVFQFRNQPNETVLAEKGFNQATIDEIVRAELTTGGPATGIITIPIEGELHYQFSIREGAPMNWTLPTERVHTSSFHIEVGKWYDFVVQMKYSQKNDGRFRVWVYERGQNKTVNSKPNWDFLGSTMYQYPSHFEFPIPSPEIRTGVYRHERMGNDENIEDSDRFMTKFLGPLKLWKGHSDEGFNKVKSE